jgi:hypothetical protein
MRSAVHIASWTAFSKLYRRQDNAEAVLIGTLSF